MICLRSHSWQVAELGFESRSMGLRVHTLTTMPWDMTTNKQSWPWFIYQQGRETKHTNKTHFQIMAMVKEKK